MMRVAQIRRAEPENAERIVQLWAANAIEVGGTVDSEAETAILGQIEDRMARGLGVVGVASKEAQVVGFIYGRLLVEAPHEEGLGVIDELFVEPDYRGRGIAKGLVAFAVDELVRRGAGLVIAYVDRKNEAAQGFWTHLGWDHDLIRFALYPQY